MAARRSISTALLAVPAIHLLLVGVYAAARRPLGDYAVETDFFGDYVPWARQWMAGHPSVMDGFKGPVYYLMLGISSKIASLLFAGRTHPGMEFAVGKGLSVLAAAVILLLVGGIVLRVCGARSGAGSRP